MERNTKSCPYVSPVIDVSVLAVESGFAESSGNDGKYYNDPFSDGETY